MDLGSIGGIPLEELTKRISKAIFNNEKVVIINENEEYPIKTYKGSGVRYVDIAGYSFLEQNPLKPSRYGEMARSGKKIIWVTKNHKYYARLIDDKFVMLKK